MEEDEYEILITRSINGDNKSLEKLLLSIKDYVYNISIKMLLFPEDAEDATQEILIKVITHLSAFQRRSKFTTWVYRITTNYLINFQGQKSRTFEMSFQDYASFIDKGQSSTVKSIQNDGELLLMEEEVKISCTQGMLLCLNPEDRLIYVLGEILEFNSTEAAEVLDITPDNFRKKLSRSRLRIRNFLDQKCGLVNQSNPCRCKKKIDFLLNQGLIDSVHPRFARYENRSVELLHKIEAVEKATAIYRSNPSFSAPEIIIEKIKKTLHAS